MGVEQNHPPGQAGESLEPGVPLLFPSPRLSLLLGLPLRLGLTFRLLPQPVGLADDPAALSQRRRFPVGLEDQETAAA